MTEKGEVKPILGISNDVPMLRSFVHEFKEHGYGIVHAVHPDDIEEADEKFNPQIVLWDEEVGGLFVEDFSDKKVIAILRSGEGEVHEKHRANVMESGVENYVVKPVVPSHLRWIVQRSDVARRPDVEKKGVLQFGEFTLDLDGRAGIFDGTQIDFTKTEFDLLEVLVRNGEQITTRREIEKFFYRTTGKKSRIVEENNYIGYLRKKLATNQTPVGIRTLRNAGWKLEVIDSSLPEEQNLPTSSSQQLEDLLRRLQS